MKGLLVTCGGLLTLLAVAVALMLTGHPTAALMVSNFGTLAWLLSVAVWILLVDAPRRGVKISFRHNDE